MRTAFALFAVLSSLVLSVSGQPFRIATWQVPDITLPKGVTNTPPVDPARLQAIASTLSATEADAIILYGISDGQVLKQIGDLIKPRKHSVAHHTVFRHGGSRGTIVGEPFAIFAPRQKQHSKTFDWADSGRIDFPGGFTFATFRHGGGTVAIYVAGLPGSLTNNPGSADGDYLSRKRDYAAQYVAAHAGWLPNTYTNQIFATYLTGDINPSSKRALKDDAALLLEKAGFRTLQLGPVTDKSAHSVTNSRSLDRVLDPVFTRNVEFIASRQIARPPPEHPIVICELTLKNAGGAAAAAPVKRASSKPSSSRPPQPQAAPPPVEVQPPPAIVSAPLTGSPVSNSASAPAIKAPAAAPTESIVHARWFWPAVGGGTAALAFALFFAVRSGRRPGAPLAVSRRAGDAVFVDMKAAFASAREPAIVPPEQGFVSGPSAPADNAHDTLWQTPHAHVRTQEPADPSRAGFMPHLRRLMREKLFMWLNHQRSHLIDSHETGTMAVLGLEERLEKIKDQFQDRLIAQEQRIAELDKELQAKEQIIKEKSKQEDPESNMG